MHTTRMLAALMLSLVATAALATQPAGIVKVSSGSVTIERAAKSQPAIPGTRVEVGDRVTTGRDSSVGITLRDNTLLSAGPNSVLVLEKFLFDSTTHAGAIDASINRGTLSVVSGKIVKQSPETVRFRTPNAILGVRGTSFIIDAGEGDEAR